MIPIFQRLEKKIIINNILENSDSGGIRVINPATGKFLAETANCSVNEVEKAIDSSYEAYLEWMKISPRERGDLLHKAACLVSSHEDEIVKILTLETGKSIKNESIPEFHAFIDLLKFYSGLGSEIKGETIPLSPDKMLALTSRVPHGVVAGIIAWNVPLLLMGLKIAPALLAGNTIVIKSSEYAPFAVLRVCEIMNKILPPGVFNMISGYGESAGQSLISSKKIGKIAFTGSVETGRKIYKSAFHSLSPVTLELGGKSPMIIFNDCDLERAVRGAINGMRFTRQGQSCTAASRIYVHQDIFEHFIVELKTALDKLVIGDPMDHNTDIGAIISRKQYDRINQYIEIAKQDDLVKVIKCGNLPTDQNLAEGNFMRPTLVINPSHNSKLILEEIFGPICCIVKWDDFSSVIKMANDTEYGLAATIWTNDMKSALRAANLIDAGLVQINQNLVVKANLPFGGFKNSGLGHEATIESMLEHYTKRKAILINFEE